jgi:hypothetical protein
MSDGGAVAIDVDGHDRRKVRVELKPHIHAEIARRAGINIASALAAHTPELTKDERVALEYHLGEAEGLLRTSSERSERTRMTHRLGPLDG